MAVVLLQSLVQRAASRMGVIATGRGVKGYSVMGLTPAESTLRHPRADFMADLDPRAAGSMERVGKRAGRPVRPAGGAASTTVARTAAGALLSTGTPTRQTTTFALGGCGCLKPTGAWSKPRCRPLNMRPTGANLQAV